MMIQQLRNYTEITLNSRKRKRKSRNSTMTSVEKNDCMFNEKGHFDQ